MMRSWAICCGLLIAAFDARADSDSALARKSSARDLSLSIERLSLANGMVVLLVPDPTASSVWVETTFRAGTLYEGPGKSGLAHIVEHMLMLGSTADSDYVEMLESRGATDINAFTSPEEMYFQAALPPQHLPIGLWITADRIGHAARSLDQATLDRERRVIREERTERFVDVPFGAVEQVIASKIFEPPHPLHASVIGLPDEWASISLAEARAFASK